MVNISYINNIFLYYNIRFFFHFAKTQSTACLDPRDQKSTNDQLVCLTKLISMKNNNK